jgi:hypothetical protein
MRGVRGARASISVPPRLRPLREGPQNRAAPLPDASRSQPAAQAE